MKSRINLSPLLSRLFVAQTFAQQRLSAVLRLDAIQNLVQFNGNITLPYYLGLCNFTP